MATDDGIIRIEDEVAQAEQGLRQKITTNRQLSDVRMEKVRGFQEHPSQ